jgi:hypothetical protein
LRHWALSGFAALADQAWTSQTHGLNLDNRFAGICDLRPYALIRSLEKIQFGVWTRRSGGMPLRTGNTFGAIFESRSAEIRNYDPESRIQNREFRTKCLAGAGIFGKES